MLCGVPTLIVPPATNYVVSLPSSICFCPTPNVSPIKKVCAVSPFPPEWSSLLNFYLWVWHFLQSLFFIIVPRALHFLLFFYLVFNLFCFVRKNFWFINQNNFVLKRVYHRLFSAPVNFSLLQDCLNNILGYKNVRRLGHISLKGGIQSSVWRTVFFCIISGFLGISKSKLYIRI